MSKASSAVIAAAAAAAACGSHAKPQPGAAIAHGVEAALGAADRARSPWRCAALDTPALAGDTLDGWKLDGHAMRREADGDVSIGVVADAGGAAPATLAALGRLRGRFDEAHVSLVLALGGMGATQSELEATLGVLADRATYPVVAIPGDLEPIPAHTAAVAALRKRGDHVVDGRLARFIELRGAAIGVIPGAGAQSRLVAGADGCGFARSDVEHVFAELAGRPGLRIAASAEAPREGDSGEPGLVPAPAAALDLELHGPTHAAPSAARDGGRDGRATPLSPGTSDATTRLPEPHRSSAGVLAIHGATWTWRPLVDSTR
jgi:hypothetical protein